MEYEEEEEAEKCTNCHNTSEEYEIRNCASCGKDYCSDCNDVCTACGDTMCRKCQDKTDTEKTVFWCDWCARFRCPLCVPLDGPFIKTCRHCGLQYCGTTCWKMVKCVECNKHVGCRSCYRDWNQQCLSCYKAEWTAKQFQTGLHPDFFSPQCPYEIFNLIRMYIHT